MRVLRRHAPSPEQIALINRIRSGVTVVRGAAGSGKTSTALFSLRSTVAATVNQLRATGRLPARALVLTYYRSLAGYIRAVAEDELAAVGDDLDLTVSTFDRWAFSAVPMQIDVETLNRELQRLAVPFPRQRQFVIDEANYVLGRFRERDLAAYLAAPRTGRGISPQMDRAMRERFLAEIISPYIRFKRARGIYDFHDLAAAMENAEIAPYDLIVADETQDFSANQLRAINAHAAVDGIVTFVTDTAQRIYPRGTTWAEAGIAVARSLSLSRNYRNTREIASLASAVAAGLPIDGDGTLPDPAQCTATGAAPIYAKGSFPQQVEYALSRIAEIDLEQETVGFLHLKGGGWFDYLRNALASHHVEFCELQGATEWPEGGSNVGLSTLHSAKGLEFDHVFLIGLAQECANDGEEDEDDLRDSLRRLVAMAIGRARRTVTLGSKQGSELSFFDNVDPATYRVIEL